MRILGWTNAALMAATLLAGATVLAADGPRITEPRTQWQSLGTIATHLEAQGYVLREVELDDDGVEFKGTDSTGRRVEGLVHPVSGEMIQVREDR